MIKKYIIVLCCSFFVLLNLTCCDFFSQKTQFQTCDIADYGIYIGNYDNEYAEEFIQSFFPLKIESWFNDVHYVYKAEKIDSAAFEAYLEFTIEDPEEFAAYVQNVTDGEKTVPFHYDDSFMDYTVSDILQLYFLDHLSDGTEYYHINAAKIGKILYSPREQRIIYVAIGLYDGGGTGTYYLTTFFNRFGIDPKEYEEHLQEVSENAA